MGSIYRRLEGSRYKVEAIQNRNIVNSRERGSCHFVKIINTKSEQNSKQDL